MSDLSDVDVAVAMADLADAMTLRAWRSRGDLTTAEKSDGSPVTALDLEVERALGELVAIHRPDDGFLGEELGQSRVGRRTWIVDPLDGTRTFIGGGDEWGTLIALCVDGAAEVGVYSAPARRERWVGGPEGATRRIDGATEPVTCSATSELAAARWSSNPDRRYPALDDASGRELRRMEHVGDYVGAEHWTTHPVLMVATGALDFAVQFSGGVWDHAALAGVVDAAGGRTTGLHAFDGMVVYTNAPLHTVVLAALQP